MKIGIDIDGTLTDINDWMIKKAIIFAKEKNINLKVDETSYDYDGMFDWSQDVLQEYLNVYFRDYLTDCDAEENSSNILNKLKEEGNEIIIVTARGLFEPELKVVGADETKSLTLKWLEKNNFHYDRIYLGQKNKEEVWEKEKFDVFIDDVEHNVYTLAKHIPVIVPERPYNLNIEGENITRANSWDEIYKLIKNM